MFSPFFTNKKKIIKQLLDMIEYLIADNNRLRQKIERIEHRQGLRFGGTQELIKNKKSNWVLFTPTIGKRGLSLPILFIFP